MSKSSSPLAKMQGPTGDANLITHYARKLWKLGGAFLSKPQMDALSPGARAEVEAQMTKAYGKRDK